MGNLRYTHIRLLKVSFGFSDTVNICVFVDGIAGYLFENPADIRLTQEKLPGQFFQGNGAVTVFGQII